MKEAPAVSQGGVKGRSLHTFWPSLLFMLGICGFLVLHFQGSLWSVNLDLAHHYALVARIEEYGRLPTTRDPSLGEMNVYPRFAHMLAAGLGTLSGSPLAGMQLAAFLSLAGLWAAIAFMFFSLPRRSFLIVAAAVAGLWALDRLFLPLELFGNELIGNYFFAQLVAQAAGMFVIVVVLFMERARQSPVSRYVVLGCAVPIIQQIHALPALELLAVLTALVTLDFVTGAAENRVTVFLFGVIVTLAALAVTALNPQFAIMAGLSDNNGVLNLNYTPNTVSLTVESLVVVALSAFLLWQWSRPIGKEARRSGLVLKYWGLFGGSVACVCLLQIAALQLGLGSLYACKKYAFGLNTALLLGLALLAVRAQDLVQAAAPRSASRRVAVLGQALPGLFVLAACFGVLPSPSSPVIAVADVIPVERFALKYRQAHPGSTSGNYDYGIGLFGGLPGLDYLISIGVLKAPRDRNADDIFAGNGPSKRGEVGRIFTREGSTPWDVPECRILVTKDGFAILDGMCVLKKVESSN